MIYMENIAKLLEADFEDLKKLFTMRLISVSSNNKRQSVYTSPCLNKAECDNRRNCMMRFLYEKLFLWLVKAINKTINRHTGDCFLGKT